jgi:rubrerythrin
VKQISARKRFRCSDCGYGASAVDPPPRCPMCGGSRWDDEEWHRFRRLAAHILPGHHRDTSR